MNGFTIVAINPTIRWKINCSYAPMIASNIPQINEMAIFKINKTK